MNDIELMLSREAYEDEINLIGALMAENSLINDLKVDDRYFTTELNKKLIKAIRELNSKDSELNIVSLHEKVSKHITITDLMQILNVGFLYNSSFNTIQNKVIKNFNKRKCLELSNYINRKLVAGEEPQSIFNHISNSLNNADMVSDKTYSIGEVMETTIDKIESNYKSGGSVTGMTTGYKNLDAILNGIEKKKYIIIGARPGVGKTAFSLEISRRLAVKNKVMFFSLEMAKEELGERLISSTKAIQNYKVRTGKLSDGEFSRLMESAAEISELKLTVDDTEAISVEELCRRATRHKNKHGLDVVVVDYLTLLSTEESHRDIRESVNIISNKLRQLSKKLDIAVICLCQLNRAVEGRQDKKPTVADLKESGNIEQDANIILLLHSEVKEQEEGPEELNVIVGKNRAGVANITIPFNYYKKTQVISEKYC